MIIVFGSLNIDLIVRVKDFPAPGETILTGAYDWAPGGKGCNQAVAAARAGGRVALIGTVGDDGFANRLREVCRHEGILASGLGHVKDPTGTAFILVNNQGENQITVASSANLASAADQVPDEILNEGATVLCQMELVPEQTYALLRRARMRGARTILNLAPFHHYPKALLPDLDVLIVNEIESAQLAADYGLHSDTPEQTAQALVDVAEHDLTVVVTCGAEGVVAVNKRGTYHAKGLVLEEVTDTTGAGDTFCGFLTSWLHAGQDLEEALRAAAVAGSLTCTAVGAQKAIPYLDDVKRHLREAE